jgi:hypothetical protein
VEKRAVRLVLRDDLERSRLTVFFRFFLALPHIIWLAIWFSVAVFPVAVANWIATLISGESSPTLHRFLAAYTRYAAHVMSYVLLVANPFPGFTGRADSYPVDVEVAPPGRQNRWKTGFRLFLALPAMLLADTMVGFGTSLAGGASTYGGGVAVTAAFLGWFYVLARGRMERGLRDVAAWGIGYSAQVTGYLLMLTDRYPDSDPCEGPWVASNRPHPIALSVDDDLRRSRLMVFFRLPLAIPHLVWLVLWSVVVFFAVVANWFVTLFRGRPAEPLHRFLTRFTRYQTHVYAFLGLAANPFPGFTGLPGSYPTDISVAPPERQNRWKTGFRLLLAIPAFFLGSAIGSVGWVATFLGWFAAIFTGRMPLGLRNVVALSLRYGAQLAGYGLLLTDRYPYSGPVDQRAPAPEPLTI